MFRRRYSSRTLNGFPMRGLTIHARPILMTGEGDGLSLGNNSKDSRELLKLKLLVVTHFLKPAMDNDIVLVKKNYHLQSIIVNKMKTLINQNTKQEIETYLLTLQLIMNAMHLDFENTNLLVKMHGNDGVQKLVVQTPAIMVNAAIHAYHIIFGKPDDDEDITRLEYNGELLDRIKKIQEFNPLIMIEDIKRELEPDFGELFLDKI